MTLRVLSAADVRAALPMPSAIEAMREAFTLLATGAVEMPVRARIPLPDSAGTFLVMSARAGRAFGAKLVAVMPQNASRGLPTVHATVVLFDPDTGAPAALLDGTALTALRTGAVSGLATDLLARRDAARVAIIGSGVQARTQLEAVCCVRRIAAVSVWSRTTAHAELFAREMTGVAGVPSIEVAESAAAAARDAEIICSATSSATPVLRATDVDEGAHVNAVGSFTPAMVELEPALLGRARVVVDQREAAMVEAGEVIAAVRDRIVAEDDLLELGSVVTGRVVGRQDSREITVFKSVGLAVQDVVAGARCLPAAGVRKG